METSERAWLQLAIGGLFAILAGIASLAGEGFFDAVSYGAAALAVLSVIAAIRELIEVRSLFASGQSRRRPGGGPSRALEGFVLAGTAAPEPGGRVRRASARDRIPGEGDRVPPTVKDEAPYPPQRLWGGAGESPADPIEVLTRYLAEFEQAGERWAQANVYNLIGFLHERRADLRKASAAHAKALELFRDLGDPVGESDSLNNLGVVDARSGNYGQALAFHGEALKIRARLVLDPKREANSHNNIGVACARVDRQKAREAFAKAYELAHEAGDSRGQGKALNNLAVCYLLEACLDEARVELDKSLGVRPADDRRGRAKTFNNLASLQILLSDDLQAAYDDLDESVALAGEVYDVRSQWNTMNNMRLLIALDGQKFSGQRVGGTGRPLPSPRAREMFLRDGEVVEVDAKRLGSPDPLLCILSSGSMSPEVSLDVLQEGLEQRR